MLVLEWNPVDLGYAAVYTARALANGTDTFDF